MDNRGISTIVATLLIVLLVIIAVGLVWFVIRGALESGAGATGLGAKCLELNIEATKVTCTGAGVCNATIKRQAGGDAIAGVKLVFANDENSFTHNINESITELQTKTESGVVTAIANVTKVDIVPYFEDESGNEQLCSAVSTFEDVAIS